MEEVFRLRVFLDNIFLYLSIFLLNDKLFLNLVYKYYLRVEEIVKFFMFFFDNFVVFDVFFSELFNNSFEELF